MKKIVFLLLLLLPISVYADITLDNYSIEVSLEGKYIYVNESFDVIDMADTDVFSKKIGNKSVEILYSNIEDLQYIEETIDDTYFYGKISNNKNYIIKYRFDNIIRYNQYIPSKTIINNVNIKINFNTQYVASFNQSGSSYSIDQNLGKIEGHSNGSISYLDNSIDIPEFFVTFRERYNRSKVNTNIGDTISREKVIGTKRTQIMSATSLLFAIIAGILSLKEKVGKEGIIAFVIIVFVLVVIQYIITLPIMLLFVGLYGVFYSLLFWKSFPIGLGWKIFMFLFITFHSLMSVGISIGIIPHIINSIAIVITGSTFRKFLD